MILMDSKCLSLVSAWAYRSPFLAVVSREGHLAPVVAGLSRVETKTALALKHLVFLLRKKKHVEVSSLKLAFKKKNSSTGFFVYF